MALSPSSKRTSESTDAAAPSCAGTQEPSLFYLAFNQDQSCIACGTSSGFRIFSSDPLRELFRREFDGGKSSEAAAAATSAAGAGGRLSHLRRYTGPSPSPADGASPSPSPLIDAVAEGFTIVEMLFRCNLLALVSPRYSPNKVIIWDDHQGLCVGELLFRTRVRAVRLLQYRIVVVLEHKIYTYSLSDLRLVHQVETLANPRGICALSSTPDDSSVMACPGLNCGEARVELYGCKKTRFLQAHTSALACMSLCLDGTLLATASSKGTLVRLFNTSDGTKVQELRRGADRADIHSLAFSSNGQWLAVSSDKGTIHVFCLKDAAPCVDGRSAGGLRMTSSIPTSLSSSISSGIQLARSSFLSLTRSNTGSSLSFMKGVLPRYFSSEWSFAQFRLPEDAHALVAFGSQRNTVIVLCSNGSYYKCSFDVFRGGEMVMEENMKILKAPFAS